MGIKTSEELEEAIHKASLGDKTSTWDVANYKLYNYYYNMHIKQGSEEDKKNEILFKQLELGKPDLHKEVESIVDIKLKMMDIEEI